MGGITVICSSKIWLLTEREVKEQSFSEHLPCILFSLCKRSVVLCYTWLSLFYKKRHSGSEVETPAHSHTDSTRESPG